MAPQGCNTFYLLIQFGEYMRGKRYSHLLTHVYLMLHTIDFMRERCSLTEMMALVGGLVQLMKVRPTV